MSWAALRRGTLHLQPLQPHGKTQSWDTRQSVLAETFVRAAFLLATKSPTALCKKRKSHLRKSPAAPFDPRSIAFLTYPSDPATKNLLLSREKLVRSQHLVRLHHNPIGATHPRPTTCPHALCLPNSTKQTNPIGSDLSVSSSRKRHRKRPHSHGDDDDTFRKRLSHMRPMGPIPWRVQAPRVEATRTCPWASGAARSVPRRHFERFPGSRGHFQRNAVHSAERSKERLSVLCALLVRRGHPDMKIHRKNSS